MSGGERHARVIGLALLGVIALFAAILRFSLPDTRSVATQPSVDGPAPVQRASPLALNRKASPFSLPSPDAQSRDPGERLISSAVVMREAWSQGQGGTWERNLLVRCAATGRKLGCREQWRNEDGPPRLIKRQLFSGEHVLLDTRQAQDDHKLDSTLAALGFRVEERIAENLYTVSLPAGEPALVADAVRLIDNAFSGAATARPDFIGFGGAAAPNDTYFRYQWNLLSDSNTLSPGPGSVVAGADIAATALWEVIQANPLVTVAILDTGVRTNHPDLAGLTWRGTNLVSTNANFADDNGHGTGVVGVIAANRNNAAGIAGIGGRADYLIVKVLNSINYGTTSDVIKGLDYARSNGATVVNMSLIGFPNDAGLRDAVARCASNGIVLCVSAGNSGANNDVTPDYPSSFTNANIISVANHDWTDARWTGGTNTNSPSNFGATNVDIFAPGASIPSPDLTRAWGDYSWWTGTSFATPHVTAVAAMIKSLNPSWAAPQIKAAILSSVVTNANYAGLCVSGGRLNSLGAVGRAVTQMPTNNLDADGAANLLEYLAGTRADDQASQPLVAAVRDAVNFSITMPRVARPYATLVGEQSLTPADLGTWSTNGVVDAGDASTFRARVPHAGLDKAFLRIRAVPSP